MFGKRCSFPEEPTQNLLNFLHDGLGENEVCGPIRLYREENRLYQLQSSTIRQGDVGPKVNSRGDYLGGKTTLEVIEWMRGMQSCLDSFEKIKGTPRNLIGSDQ